MRLKFVALRGNFLLDAWRNSLRSIVPLSWEALDNNMLPAACLTDSDDLMSNSAARDDQDTRYRQRVLNHSRSGQPGSSASLSLREQLLRQSCDVAPSSLLQSPLQRQHPGNSRQRR